MDTLNVLIHVLAAFVCFMLGFWLALEQAHANTTQQLRDLFFTWEVEDSLRNERATAWVNQVRALWWNGRCEEALQWSYIYSTRDKRLAPLYLAVRQAYTARIERERMEAVAVTVTHVVTRTLTAPVRDARGRFVKGNKYRFPRRTTATA